ncbi:MAG: cardiolipin synthase [Chthoniobacterales bacterium]
MISHWFNFLLGTFIVIMQVLGILCAVRALFIARTPQASIAWGFSLICLPYVAIPLFLVFGESRFAGYIRAASGKSHQLDHVFRKIQALLKLNAENFPQPYELTARVADRMTGLPSVGGNDLELLIDGKQTFDAIFEAIDSAKNYLLVQFFIVHNDELGKALHAHLLAAAARGVRIWVLLDGVGSRKLDNAYLDSLHKAGAEVARFVTNRQIWKQFQINFRNHRKLVVADGKTAFVGGLNVGDEYMGRSKRFGPWRDTHMRITGPAVDGLQFTFIEDWNYATGVVIHLNSPDPVSCGSGKVFTLASGPADAISACQMIYLEAIHAAQKRLWIASPYFVPDFSLKLALQSAALRGVDVRLLLPKNHDHYLPWLSSFSFYPSLQRAGIKVFRYQPGFMHQKVMLADDEFAIVGSINLDYRSFLLNFELSAGVHDKKFAADLEQMFLEDFRKSKEEDLSIFERGSLLFRFKVRLAALLSPEQ